MNIEKLKFDTLYQTTEYECFEMHPHNRDVKKTSELEKSMKTHGYIPAYPLHVNKTHLKLIVKAGHHRLYVAQSLKLPIWFIVCRDNAEIRDLEFKRTAWTIDDFLTSYSRGGNENYIQLLDFKEQSKLRTSICASLLGGQSATSGNCIKKIRTGDFEVKSHVFAYEVSSMIRWLSENGIKHAYNNLFVGAISKVMQVREFDAKQFKDRVCANAKSLVNCATEKQFIENIAEVYNTRSRNKIPLVYLTQELMNKKNFIKYRKYSHSMSGGARRRQRRAINSITERAMQ